MSKLVRDLGIKVSKDRAFSPSFLEGFSSCGHRMLLSRILHLPSRKDKEATIFGTAFHSVMALVNKGLMNEQPVCGPCPNPCKVASNMFHQHKLYDNCLIVDACDKEAERSLSPLNAYAVLERYAEKNKLEQGEKELARLRAMLPFLIMRTLEVIPYGKVIFCEEEVNAELSGYKFRGFPDLVIMLPDGRIALFDYKTRSSKPSERTFPMRQLSVYKMALDKVGIHIDLVGAIYVVKSATGNIVVDLREIPDESQGYQHTLKMLVEDTDEIWRCMESGIFLRNRKDMYHPCEYAKFCENEELTKASYSEDANNLNEEYYSGIDEEE